MKEIIIDDISSAPISHANIDVCVVVAKPGKERSNCGISTKIRHYESDDQGRFAFPRQKAWDILMIGATSCSSPAANLRIYKSGYQTIELRWNQGLGRIDLSKIRLKADAR